MTRLRNLILRTIDEAVSKGAGKSATLTAMYDSDLRMALFNLKQRNIIRSSGGIRKAKNGYRVSVKYNGSKKLLKDAIINFYGRFVRVA